MSINLAGLWRVIVLGIVEGITEFLPISSTGHLIVFADFLNFKGSMGGTFEIFIQLGAVLAVVWYYRRDLWQQALRCRRTGRCDASGSTSLSRFCRRLWWDLYCTTGSRRTSSSQPSWRRP